MFAIVIWVLIVLVVYFWRRKILDSFVAFVATGVMLFGFAFMADNFSPFNLRNVFPSFMYFYDTTKKDPVKKAQDEAKKVSERGEKFKDKVNTVGSNLDKKYLSDTEASKESSSMPLQDSKLIEKEGENTIRWGSRKLETKDSSEDMAKDGERHSKPRFVAFRDVDEMLQGKLNWLPKDDQELLKTLTPYNTEKVQGDRIVLRAGKESNLTGIYLEYR